MHSLDLVVYSFFYEPVQNGKYGNCRLYVNVLSEFKLSSSFTDLTLQQVLG
jgi:hypothetical protein